MDIVTPAIRSRMMAGIKAKGTRPEILLRSALHRAGYRFRLHRKDLPGQPDIVLPKHRAAIFVNGCFWHRHECHLFKWPKSNTDFWKSKISANANRDLAQQATLHQAGWRVIVVWECALKGRKRLDMARIVEKCSAWLQSGETHLEIAGE